MKIPKTIVSLFLTCLVLVNVLTLSVVRAGFELNRDFISKNLCINISKPEKKCEGRCYLKKQLKKAGQTGSNTSAGASTKIIAFDYLPPAEQPASILLYAPQDQQRWGTLQLFAYNQYQHSILQPPQ